MQDLKIEMFLFCYFNNLNLKKNRLISNLKKNIKFNMVDKKKVFDSLT